MADRDLRIRGQAVNGHVPILHTSLENPRCACPHIHRSSRKLRPVLLSRLTFKQSPGQRLSVGLAPSAKKTRLRPYHRIPLPTVQLPPPSLTPTISLTAFCDKKTTLSPCSTRNCSTCVFPSPRRFGASFRLRRVRDVCSPRR